jgi:hypothetical protein
MMPRQRLGLTHSWATTLGQKLMVVPAVALLYGGAVVLALGAGVAPRDVDAITGYETVYERLGALDPANWSQGVTIGVAIAGLLGFLVLVRLGWAQRLIPHVTRAALVLREEDDGTTTVSPRAVERAAEIAARHPGVKAVKATLGEGDLHLAVHARRAELIPEVLQHARSGASRALEQAGLTDIDDVRVAVTRFTPASKKERLA